MTISVDHVEDLLQGNGSNRYSIDWQVKKNGDLSEISITKLDKSGVETTLQEGVDFTLIINSLGEGATIILDKALTSQERIRIRSERPFTQESHFPPGSNVDPIQLEGNLDDNVIQHLQLWRTLGGKVNSAYNMLTGQYASITMHPAKADHITIYKTDPVKGDTIVDSGFAISQVATDQWIKPPTAANQLQLSAPSTTSPTGFGLIPYDLTNVITTKDLEKATSAEQVPVSAPFAGADSGFKYTGKPLSTFITTDDMKKPTTGGQVPFSVPSTVKPNTYTYDHKPIDQFITTADLDKATGPDQILVSGPAVASGIYKFGTEPKSNFITTNILPLPTGPGQTLTTVDNPAVPGTWVYKPVTSSKDAAEKLVSTGILSGMDILYDGIDTITITPGEAHIVTASGQSQVITKTSDEPYTISTAKDGDQFLYLGANNMVASQTTYPSSADLHDKIWLAVATVHNGAVVRVERFKLEDTNAIASSREMMDILGPETDVVVGLSGFSSFVHGGGSFRRFGIDARPNAFDKHTVNIVPASNVPFRFCFKDTTRTDTATAVIDVAANLPYEDVVANTKGIIPAGKWGVFPVYIASDGTMELAASQGYKDTLYQCQELLDQWTLTPIHRLAAYRGFLVLKSGATAATWDPDHLLVICNQLTRGRIPSKSVGPAPGSGSGLGIEDANAVISGMIATVDTGGTSVSIAPGQAMFIDRANPEKAPVIVDMPATNNFAITRIADTEYTYLYANKDGTYSQSDTYENTARGDKMLLAVLEHTGNSKIQYIRHLALNADALPKQIYDIYGILGNHLDKYYIEKSVVGTNGFASFSGVFKGFAVNPADHLDYSEIDIPAADPAPFYLRRLNGDQTGPETAFTSTTITMLESGTAIPAGHYCYMPILVYPDGKLYIQYPQESASTTELLGPVEKWFGQYKLESALKLNGALVGVLLYKQGTDLSAADNEILIASNTAFSSGLPGSGSGTALPKPNPDGSDVGKAILVGPGNQYGLIQVVPTPAPADSGKVVSVDSSGQYALTTPSSVPVPTAAGQVLLSVETPAGSGNLDWVPTDKGAIGGGGGSGGSGGSVTGDVRSYTIFPYLDATTKTGLTRHPIVSLYYSVDGMRSPEPTGQVAVDYFKHEILDYFPGYLELEYVFNVVDPRSTISDVYNLRLQRAGYDAIVGKKIGVGPNADVSTISVPFENGTDSFTLKAKSFAGLPIVKEMYAVFRNDKGGSVTPKLIFNGNVRDRLDVVGFFGYGYFNDFTNSGLSVVMEFTEPVRLKFFSESKAYFSEAVLTGIETGGSQTARFFSIRTGDQFDYRRASDGQWVVHKGEVRAGIFGVEIDAIRGYGSYGMNLGMPEFELYKVGFPVLFSFATCSDDGSIKETKASLDGFEMLTDRIYDANNPGVPQVTTTKPYLDATARTGLVSFGTGLAYNRAYNFNNIASTDFTGKTALDQFKTTALDYLPAYLDIEVAVDSTSSISTSPNGVYAKLADYKALVGKRIGLSPITDLSEARIPLTDGTTTMVLKVKSAVKSPIVKDIYAEYIHNESASLKQLPGITYTSSKTTISWFVSTRNMEAYAGLILTMEFIEPVTLRFDHESYFSAITITGRKIDDTGQFLTLLHPTWGYDPADTAFSFEYRRASDRKWVSLRKFDPGQFAEKIIAIRGAPDYADRTIATGDRNLLKAGVPSLLSFAGITNLLSGGNPVDGAMTGYDMIKAGGSGGTNPGNPGVPRMPIPTRAGTIPISVADPSAPGGVGWGVADKSSVGIYSKYFPGFPRFGEAVFDDRNTQHNVTVGLNTIDEAKLLLKGLSPLYLEFDIKVFPFTLIAPNTHVDKTAYIANSGKKLGIDINEYSWGFGLSHMFMKYKSTWKMDMIAETYIMIEDTTGAGSSRVSFHSDSYMGFFRVDYQHINYAKVPCIYIEFIKDVMYTPGDGYFAAGIISTADHVPGIDGLLSKVGHEHKVEFWSVDSQKWVAKTSGLINKMRVPLPYIDIDHKGFSLDFNTKLLLFVAAFQEGTNSEKVTTNKIVESVMIAE